MCMGGGGGGGGGVIVLVTASIIVINTSFGVKFHPFPKTLDQNGILAEMDKAMWKTT